MLSIEFNDLLECFDVLDDDFLVQELSLSEAEELLEQLQTAVDTARESLLKYVQVRFDLGSNSQTRTYTYIDPSGQLKAGDLVQVPVFGSMEHATTAKVVALGRGDYVGRCATVAAKLEATPL